MTETVHVMLDLETWGKIPGSDIRSIGACVFDPIVGAVSTPCSTCKGGTARGNVNDGGDCSDCLNTRLDGGFGDMFYIATENPTYEIAGYFDGVGGRRKYPLTRDASTVEWWSKQSAEAQAAFANPVDLRVALEQFTIWLNALCSPTMVPPSGGHKNLRLWANDPHFDVSILAACFRAVGMPEPWHYRSPRSMKTITEAAGMTSDDYYSYGTGHHALDDAIAQAMTVCKAHSRLGLHK